MLNGNFSRLLGWMLIAFVGAVAGTAHAGGVFDSVTGDVTVIAPNGSRTAAQRFADIPTGSVVSTGSGAQAVLRFDDSSAVVLNQNTDFRIVDFRYNAAKPETGRSVFDFLKGAARFVTGLIARAEPANYSLRTAQATIGVRGTDFSLASGSLYLSVGNGTVTATNAAGSSTFTAGQLGFTPNAATLPTLINTSQLPGVVANSLSRLSAIPLPQGTLPPEAGGTATGAGEA
ncbi:MAG: FecR domain-containing protein, partial [Burkholderiales bacterium]